MPRSQPLFAFFEECRDAIISAAVEKARALVPGDEAATELERQIERLVDELIPALRRAAGLHATSPLPDASEAAEQVGVLLKDVGQSPATIARCIGAVSDGMGQVASERGLAFDAREYRAFNQCIDAALAGALETYVSKDRDEQKRESVERIGLLAHELRNAIAAGQLAFSLLKRGDVGVNSRTGAILERSLERTDALIRRTLVAAQLGAGAPLAWETVFAGALVKDVVSAAELERGVRVEMDVDPTLELDADPRVLTSAISNLVQNGIKYTRAGGTVIVRAFANERVVIEVEDECGGLPPGESAQLFEAFRRRTAERSGFGLGLVVVDQAAKAHGGTVSVRDIPGKGCVFAMHLPRRCAATTAA